MSAARDWRFVAALAAIVVVGAGLRFYRLDELPPGLAFDEAWEGIDGARILAGARPRFLPENNGREPLFAYTVAPWIALVGQTPLAVRAAAATWGTLTVLAMAGLGGAFGGRWVALTAGGLVAASYWPLHLSRVGIRPGALPPLEALAMAGLLLALGWQGAGIRRWVFAAAGGAALGLSLYTYLPARLMVPICALAVLAAAVRDWRRALAVGAVTFGVAAVIVAPLARHYQREPEDFLGRSGQVTVMNAIRTGADAREVLTENLVATLGALCCQGDAQARHNLPGRPIFDPLSLLLFLGGLALMARRRAVVVLVWLVVMLVPAWLSDSAPHQLRMVGALVPLYLVAAAGLAWAIEGVRRAPHGLLAGALLLVGGLTARDYFWRFGEPAVSAAPFDADVVAIAGALGDREAIVGPIEPDHPTLRYLGKRPLTFPVAGLPLVAGPVEYLLRDDASVRAVAEAYPGAAWDQVTVAPPVRAVTGNSSGVPTVPPSWGGVMRARVAAGAMPRAPTASRPVAAVFGPISLVGFDAGTAAAGAELPLRLYWRADTAPGERLTASVHLVDASGRAWAQEDLEPGAGGLPTDGWRAGQITLDDRRLPLPPGIPPGEYALRVGLVRAGGGRLPLKGGGDFATLAPVSVTRGAGRLNLWRLQYERIEQEMVAGGQRVRLVGARIDRARVEAGETVPVLLLWEWAGRAPGLRAQLLPDERALPVGGGRPIDQWQPGELVQERRDLPIAADIAPGREDLILRVVAADGAQSSPVRLGAVEVTSRPRVFERTTPSQRIGVRFGDFAELAGFDVSASSVRPGGSLRVRLHWRALATPVESYVVFLHLVDEKDQVRAQVDSPPATGRAQTPTWLPGETIVDERELVLPIDTPLGRYRLAAGLYLPVGGARAQLFGTSGDRALFGEVQVTP